LVVLIGSKSILVLDDEFDVMNIIKLGLQKKGSFEVYGFTDPMLALEHLKADPNRYSLIISDIRMPKMNGYEFVTYDLHNVTVQNSAVMTTE
jgi:CheY-like chemotaxis protein